MPSLASSTAQHGVAVLGRSGRVPLLVILLWAVTLWWGERYVFTKSVAACEWHLWESWPTTANPHHVLFVADPQLVDPHTYPDRPWPLSTLTVLYTDLYLRRSYGYLLDRIQPHTTIFLGDLFDGGREWAAVGYSSPEDRYKRYGTKFWLREYNRFMDMFVGRWHRNSWNHYLTGEGRKIIASLPGNHDLGFAGGINEHVRDRFEAHFGPSNRIDILGNHSFVSLDTVSLSAMDQVDPSTGGSGAGDGTGHDTKHMEIWKPIEHFLIDAKNRRAKAVQRRYDYFKSLTDPKAELSADSLHMPRVKSVEHKGNAPVPIRQKAASVPSSNFPTILLSHVPLYRNQDVTCGPLRERGNAIPLSAGYQYQNVLTPAVSKDIIDHLGAEQISMIYSGDDHDYCEIEHGEFNGRIKEITVKSMSWAMGVRKPGVQLASLWNPIDIDAISRGEASMSTPHDTVQNRLCLLPDQLSIFIRYGQVLAATIIILLLRAATYNAQQAYRTLSTPPAEMASSQPLLPLNRKHTPPSSPQLTPTSSHQESRNARARTRSIGKLNTQSNMPASSRSTSTSSAKTELTHDIDDWSMPTGPQNTAYGRTQASARTSYPFLTSSTQTSATKPNPARRGNLTRIENIWHNLSTPASTKPGEFARSFCIVAGPVLLFYFWLLWHG